MLILVSYHRIYLGSEIKIPLLSKGPLPILRRLSQLIFYEGPAHVTVSKLACHVFYTYLNTYEYFKSQSLSTHNMR